MTDTAVPVLIVIGSNVDSEHRLREAVGLLADQMLVRRVSRVYASPPMDGKQGPDFLDVAVLVDAIDPALSPAELKYRVLRPLEAALGRDRAQDHTGLFPIDFDIAYWGNRVIEEPEGRIRIPHRDVIRQPHVAVVLADLAPDFVNPETGQTLAEIAEPYAGSAKVWPSPVTVTP